MVDPAATALMEPAPIAKAFRDACEGELQAIKAGNVHIHAGGHDMVAAQFIQAAAAAAPHISDPNARTGEKVLAAVRASLAVAGCNTNLGILLLCAPLARACHAGIPGDRLRARLISVLETFDQADADAIYTAIAEANPGGLGKVEDGDVTGPQRTLPLIEAMRLAQDRDRIAKAYVTGFTDVFDFALPHLEAARREEKSEEDAIASLHLTLLSTFPDSHIARKYGPDRAEEVRSAAAVLRPRIFPMTSREARNRLLAFDASLKNDQLNPGTTADFIVATLFADNLLRRGRQPVAV